RFPAFDAPFEANKRYHSDTSYGVLAVYGNVPEMRRYYSETFTADSRGFRNPPGTESSSSPEMMVVGSSFAAGQGLNDDQTLAQQLSRATGRRVYNAAGGNTYRLAPE